MLDKWSQFLEFAKSRCSASAFGNWLKPIRVIEGEEGYLNLEVPNIFVKEYLLTNYRSELGDFIPVDDNGDAKITFRIAAEKKLEMRTPVNVDSDGFVRSADSREHCRNIFKKKLPPSFWDVSFETCVKIHGEKTMEPLYGWIEHPVQSIFLYGLHGRGKSCTAAALVLEFLYKNADKYPSINDFEFASADYIGTALRKHATADGGEFNAVQTIKNFMILAIDDFGRESQTDYIKRKLFDIIDHRHAWRLPTIITSNLTAKEISQRYDPGILSRMQEWLWIQFGGHDLRSGNYET